MSLFSSFASPEAEQGQSGALADPDLSPVAFGVAARWLSLVLGPTPPTCCSRSSPDRDIGLVLAVLAPLAVRAVSARGGRDDASDDLRGL